MLKGGKFYALLKHISAGTVQCAVASAALAAGIFLECILQVGEWARVTSQARHYFPTYITSTDQHQDSVQCSVIGLTEVTCCW